MLLLAACSQNIHNTEAVRQGVITHLANNSGLDLSSMDIEVASVVFRENEADATVSFRPKGSTDPSAGMQMNYTLERQGDRWVVKSKAEGGSPHSGGMTGGGEMPQGHPPMGGSGSGSGGALPPGHPPVGGGQ